MIVHQEGNARLTRRTTMASYKFKGWTITHKGSTFTAHKGSFFTGYHVCDTTGEFLDILEKQYGKI